MAGGVWACLAAEWSLGVLQMQGVNCEVRKGMVEKRVGGVGYRNRTPADVEAHVRMLEKEKGTTVQVVKPTW